MRRLAGILCLFIGISCLAQPYSFPVRPGTKEWVTLGSYQSRIEQCQVPEGVLCSMSNSDLIQTCLNHPFLINILLFSSYSEGVESLKGTFNVFRELESRPRAKELGLSFLERISAKEKEEDRFEDTIQKVFLKTWLGVREELNSVRAVTVKTPKGSIVADTAPFTGVDWTTYEKNQFAQWVLSTYPGVTIVGPATKKYNCHAYAWHVSEGGAPVWMGIYSNPTSIYWADGSYSATSCHDNGLKVAYPGSANHSAVTTSTLGVFISKWGNGPLVRHTYNNCPYSSTVLNYYIRNYPSQSYVQGKYAQNSQWFTLNTVNMVNRTIPITIRVDYPNAYLITWEKTSGGSDVQYGAQTSDGKTAGLTMNSSHSVSLKATAHIPCGTVETEFYFISTR